MRDLHLAAPRWRRFGGTAFLLLVLAAVTVLLNPRRELLTWDDGWAYARSVVTMLESGRYALDNWAAANTPVQIALAALESKIFGYSLVLLRLDTMALLVVLVLAFRSLAQASGSPPDEAVVLSLALVASPVLLMLSFTFMSDVQFLAWLILALTLYQRGLRLRRALPIIGGSIAAACAIGTRQIGIAILGGWLVAFLVARSEERPALRILVLAVALPIALSAWQFWQGAAAPNFTQAYRLAEQRVLFARPVRELGIEAVWRAAIWLRYSALYLLPITPLVVAASLKRIGSSTSRVRLRGLILTFALCAFVAIGLILNSGLTVRPEPSRTPWPWPPLGLIWMCTFNPGQRPISSGCSDLAGFFGVIPLSWLFFSRDKLLPVRRPSPAALLISGTGAGLFAASFFYVQLNDTYIFSLLPFTLLAISVALRDMKNSRFLIGATELVWSLAMIFTVTNLTRRGYDKQQVRLGQRRKSQSSESSHSVRTQGPEALG